MKGITAYIYKNSLFKGCSLNGISERCEKVTVVSSKDFKMPEIFEASEDQPAVFIEKGPLNTIRAVPVDKPENRHTMDGGSFIATCDSRFVQAVGTNKAIPLHDRHESYKA